MAMHVLDATAHRSAKEGGAQRRQSLALNDNEFSAILEHGGLDQPNAWSVTKRLFFSLGLEICLRGQSEHHQLRFLDFTIVQLPGGDALKWSPTTAFKNWTGNLKDRGQGVSLAGFLDSFLLRHIMCLPQALKSV